MAKHLVRRLKVVYEDEDWQLVPFSQSARGTSYPVGQIRVKRAAPGKPPDKAALEQAISKLIEEG